MLVNATNEMAAATDAVHDKSTDPQQSERRLHNAKKNQEWTTNTLLEHLGRCSACRERESALRPAYKDPVKFLKI